MRRRSLVSFAVLVLVVLVPTTGGEAAPKKTKGGSCSLTSGSDSGMGTQSGTQSAFGSGPSANSDASVAQVSGGDLNGQSLYPAVSDDGRYVAFDTSATNGNPADPDFDILAVPDTNGHSDIYVLDRDDNSLLRVTYNYLTTSQANANSYGPKDVSADGRYIVYASGATNLGPSDTNGVWDVYRFDQLTGENRLVSLNSSGAQGNGVSSWPSISADGNMVAFASDATNLVANDTNGKTDSFVRDITAGTTIRVSVDSSGAQASLGGQPAHISGNGRFVVFNSLNQLVPEDGNLFTEVYLRDLQAAQTSRVSVSVTGGDPVGGSSYNGDISYDGRYVAFTAAATNLVSDDQNGTADVFVRDRTLGITLRASVGPNGGGNNSSQDATISNDGHYVAFGSQATNLWPTTDGNGSLTDVFEFDVWANSLAGHLSVGPDDVWANGSSSWPVISGDGLYVAYASRATNLVTLDSNATDDIFTHLWVDEGRTQCDTKRRSEPRPLPIPFGPMGPGGGSKPDYDRRCQDSIATGADPAPNLTPAEWYEPPYDSFTVTHAYGGINTVKLRWGRTLHVPSFTNPRGEWLGWGYRKIKAKHGWSALIRGNVQAALLRPPTQQPGTRWAYEADYPYKGSNCRIRVVVEYAQLTFERTNNYPPAHIMTAYSWKL